MGVLVRLVNWSYSVQKKQPMDGTRWGIPISVQAGVQHFAILLHPYLCELRKHLER